MLCRAGDRGRLVPPAVPLSGDVGAVKPVTVSLKTTVKLIGEAEVGSAWPAAWLMVTVGAVDVVGDGVVGAGGGSVGVAGRVGGPPAAIVAMTVPCRSCR